MIKKVIAAGAKLPSYGVSFKYENATIGQIISDLLPYVMVAAGLSVLVMLIWGGIQLMTSGGDPAGAKAGYGKIVGALIGFVLVFITYFVAQLLELMLGVKFL